ncbi:MAG: alpha/beta fold hydrolase [Promethearchaeia archaeon]
MVEKYANVNGVKLCYEVHGEGKPLILVHGFGSKKESWMVQVPDLSKKYKVITFDNRGAGKSDRPSGNYTMELFADDIAGLLDYLKIEKAKSVIGWSLGGMIVQHFLLKYPLKTETSILLFTNYKGVGGEIYAANRQKELDFLKEDPEKCYWKGIRLSFHRKFRKELEKNPKKKFFGIWSAQDLIKESTINPPSHQDIDNQAAALDTHNTLNKLEEIENPILLVAATHDRLIPKSTMTEMHERIPHSEYKVIENAGHGAPHSRATEVNSLILEFLEEQ